MRNTFELSKLIRQNGGQLVDAFPFEEASKYGELYHLLQQSNAKKDYQFQRRYISFYKLRGAGINAIYLNRYFEIMENYKQPHRVDLRILGSALWGLRPLKAVTPTQFRYLSQLVNMCNPLLPVYNKFLASFWNFKPPLQSRLEHRERLQIYVDFYHYMEQVYQETAVEVHVKQVLKVIHIKLKEKAIRLPPNKCVELLLRETAELHENKELV